MVKDDARFGSMTATLVFVTIIDVDYSFVVLTGMALYLNDTAASASLNKLWTFAAILSVTSLFTTRPGVIKIIL